MGSVLLLNIGKARDKTHKLRASQTLLSQTFLSSSIRRITAGAAVYCRCFSIKTSSLSSQERWQNVPHFDLLLSPSGTPQVRECGVGVDRFWHPKTGLTAASDFVFFRGTSTAFSERLGSFMGVVGFPFEFCGLLARLLHIDTRYFVRCPTVVDLTEGVVQVCACDFVQSPAVGELPGLPPWPRALPRRTCRLPRSRASLASWSPQISHSSARTSKAYMVFWSKSQNFGVHLCVFSCMWSLSSPSDCEGDGAIPTVSSRLPRDLSVMTDFGQSVFGQN